MFMFCFRLPEYAIIMPHGLCKFHFKRGSRQSQCRDAGCAYLHPDIPMYLPNKFWCPLDLEREGCPDPFCYMYHSKDVKPNFKLAKKRKLEDDRPSGSKSRLSGASKLRDFFRKKPRTENKSSVHQEETRVVRQIEEPKDEVSDSTKDLEKCFKECKAKLQEYEGIEQERDDLDEEKMNFIETFERSHHLKERSLKGIIDRFQEENAKLVELETQKKEIETERDVMDSEKMDFCKSIYNLLRVEEEKRHYDLQDVQNHVEELHRSLCSLQSLINDNELNIKDLHKTIKEQEIQEQAQTKAMETLSIQIESQSKDLKIFQEKNLVLGKDLNLQIKEKEDISKKLSQNQEHIANLEHLITIHRSQSEEKEQERGSLIASLSQKIDNLEKNKIAMVEEKLNLSKENESLRKEMGESDEKICHLKKSLHSINKKSEKEKAEFAKNLKDLQGEKDNYEFVQKKLEEESKAKIDTLTDDIIALELETGHLNDQVNNLIKEKDEKQLSILARDQIINAKIEELKQMEQERDSIDEQLEEKVQELAKISENQKSLDKTNTDLKCYISKLSAKIEKQKSAFNTEVSQLEKIIASLKEEIKRKNTQNLLLFRKILPVAQKLEQKVPLSTSEIYNP